MIDIAHVHPMIVHFPIVFFITALGLELIVLARKGDLAARQCLSNTALAALVLAALAAIAAASFGDMALDKALDRGFPKGPLEEHEDFGMTTMWYFAVLAVVQLVAWWRRTPLSGGRGWALFAVGLVGFGLLIATAYHGGDLVYRLGVNVAAVKHP